MSTESTEPESGIDWGIPETIAKNAKTPLPHSGEPRPRRLWAMVDAVAEAYQVPRDMPLLLILAILAASVGGRRRVRVAPDWAEVLAVYTAVALPSGERKSPVLKALQTPLLEFEKQLAEEEAPRVARQRALRDTRAKAVEKLKNKGDTSASALADLDTAVQELEGTDIPAMPRLLADDSTPEAMASLMAEQGGRLGVLSAEGGLFSILAGRYTNGVPNLDLVLKSWSGDFCRVDRMSREPVTLSEPVLSIGLAVQPDILAGLAEAKQFRSTGLLARFLYALPESLVGNRKSEPDPVPEQVAADYSDAVKNLATSVRSSDVAEMKLSEPARALLNEYRDQIEPRLHPERGDLANIADWAVKLPGQLVRVAALFTLFDHPDATDVDEVAMCEALELAPYLVGHASAAFDSMTGRRSPLEPARAVLRWIQQKRLDKFTVRTAWRELSGQAWVGGTDDIREAIADLEEHGWVQPEPQPDKPKRGRPSEPYLVNPAAHSGNFGSTPRGGQS
ncbi:YfjI family protein [Halopolyspora algeriensis]